LQPDVVFTLTGLSVLASSPREAGMIAALNSLDSDRDFLRACGNRYQPSVSQLNNGRYRVLFTKRQEHSDSGLASVNVDANDIAFNHGLDLMALARLPEARESFMESIRINQHLQDSYTNIGYTYLDEGRLKDAVSTFEDTLRRFPGYPAALYGLALSTEKLGDTGRAVQLWRQYLDTDADPKWKARVVYRLQVLGYKSAKESSK
jgi:tetratricopeptide (TPR) repeat protein